MPQIAVVPGAARYVETFVNTLYVPVLGVAPSAAATTAWCGRGVWSGGWRVVVAVNDRANQVELADGDKVVLRIDAGACCPVKHGHEKVAAVCDDARQVLASCQGCSARSKQPPAVGANTI